MIRFRSLAITVALQAMAWTQTPVRPPMRASILESVPEPPVPSDPLELVTGDAQPVQTPQQRQAATNLLQTARAASNVRAQPYDLKTTFTAFGSSSSDGNWTLEDTSPSGKIYRWTAQGPGYSSVNLYKDRLLYSNLPPSAIPMRLTQVREAIFYTYQVGGEFMSMRTATGYLNGAEMRCVLTAPAFGGKVFTGGRNWEESEYCVDPNTGLLMLHSPAPGVYIKYDYTNGIHFHGKTIAGAFTISEGGRNVVEARTESVTDPASSSPALFDPTGMTSIGVGSMMTAASRVRSTIGPRPVNGNPKMDIVVLHGIAAPDGHLGEVEVLATSNPANNQAALDRASNWQALNPAQDGTTPQSHEIIFTYEFVTPSS